MKKNSGIRELSSKEVDEVSGGWGIFGAIIGGTAGAINGYNETGTIGGAAQQGALGALAGGTGGIAGAAYKGGRYLYGTLYAGYSVASGTAYGAASR